MPVNIIRLNQQDVSQIQPLRPDPVDGQTSENMNTSDSKSIFSLSQTTLNDQHDSTQQPKKTTLVSFTPKKFVPATKLSNLEVESICQTNQLPTNDKIKAKWSPGPTVNDQQPKYKKIQPIFQKPKSPHKIT